MLPYPILFISPLVDSRVLSNYENLITDPSGRITSNILTKALTEVLENKISKGNKRVGRNFKKAIFNLNRKLTPIGNEPGYSPEQEWLDLRAKIHVITQEVGGWQSILDDELC